MSSLLQIKVQENFLEKLKRMAATYNMSVSGFVKFILTKSMLEEERLEITENGFLKEEEERIYKSTKEAIKLKQEGKIKGQSVDNFLNEL